jgi:hypothetical protein
MFVFLLFIFTQTGVHLSKYHLHRHGQGSSLYKGLVPRTGVRPVSENQKMAVSENTRCCSEMTFCVWQGDGETYLLLPIASEAG